MTITPISHIRSVYERTGCVAATAQALGICESLVRDALEVGEAA